MEYKWEDLNIYSSLVIKGEIAEASARDFRNILVDAIERGERDVIVNLSQVPYLSSHALGSLIVAWKKMAEVRGNLCILCDNPDIEFIFGTVNMQSIIKIYKTKEELENYERLSSVNEKDGCQIVNISRSLQTLDRLEYFEKLFGKLLIKGKTNVAIDMSGIEHIFSSVLGVIIRWRKKFLENKGELCLLNVSPSLMTFLEYVQLDKEIPIRNIDAAMVEK